MRPPRKNRRAFATRLVDDPQLRASLTADERRQLVAFGNLAKAWRQACEWTLRIAVIVMVLAGLTGQRWPSTPIVASCFTIIGTGALVIAAGPIMAMRWNRIVRPIMQRDREAAKERDDGVLYLVWFLVAAVLGVRGPWGMNQ